MKTLPGRGAAKDFIVVKVPVELKGLVEPLENLIKHAESTARSMRGRGAVDYAKVEGEVSAMTGAVECAIHAEHLSKLDVDAPMVEIRGKRYALAGRSPGDYYTRTGAVKVPRSLYRECGPRNAKTVDAISLRAGVVGRGWLPGTAESMAFHMQKGTSRDARETARQDGVLPYSVASFDRVAHLVGERWMQEHADIEDELILELEIPSEAASISMSMDRVSLPMEEPGKRPAGRPRKNAAKNPITRTYRMAYCATLTLHDKNGQGIHTIRYGCMPKGDAAGLSAGLSDDVTRLIERRPDLHVSILADGAPEMWNLLEPYLDPEIAVAHKLVDFYHLIEKLSPAAKVIYGDEDGRVELARWKRSLLRRSGAAVEILEDLRQSGCEHHKVGIHQPVHDAITYLENHSERLNYAHARRNGLPIGSGNVEATCKTLVGIRMKRAGSRWKERTGEHIIRLRALGLSDRWDSAMDKLHATNRTSVGIAA